MATKFNFSSENIRPTVAVADSKNFEMFFNEWMGVTRTGRNGENHRAPFFV